MDVTTVPVPTIEAYWDLSASSSGFIIWDDPAAGWDSSAVWAGDIATDISTKGFSLKITRGRSRQLDQIQAGTLEGQLRNFDRAFDPVYASSPYAGNIRPRKRVRVTLAGQIIFDGAIDDWAFTYAQTTESIADFTAVDALADLANRNLDGFTATAGQTTGARINAVLDRAEIDFGTNRSIDTGVSTCQADTIASGTAALTYLQLVADTDLGRLFATRTNVLTFHARHAALNVDPAGVFADDGTGIRFHGIGVAYGSEFLFNSIVTSRVGGTEWTAQDATSIAEYGINSPPGELYRNLLNDDDTQTYDMGLYLLGIYANPEFRISELTIDLGTLTDLQQAQVSALDYGAVIRVIYSPSGVGPAIDQYSIIEGIEYDLELASATARLVLGTADHRAVWIWDDPILGVWDGTSIFTF